MNPHRSFLALGAATILLSAPSLIAGPGPHDWARIKPVTTTKEADALKSEDAVVMVCGACETVLVRATRHIGSPSKGTDQWFTIGNMHQCGHCGGKMSVVKGGTTNSTQQNCSMCGEGAASCCAAKTVSPPENK
jgi:hypothetical protein